MMKGSIGVAFWCFLVAAVVLEEARETAAVTCNPMELSPCMPAILVSGDPTPLCCTKLKEQEPCLCQYIKNPALNPYIESPNTKKISSICAVPIPTC